MRIAALISILPILILAGINVLAAPVPFESIDRTQPTSWSLTCQPEIQDTTDSTGRSAILKVTAQAAATGAIVHWKAPAGNWVTLNLRPVSDNTWASRVELGSEDGTHQLQCMILGAATGDGDSHILARTYQLGLPSFKLDETGSPEVWSQGEPRADLLRTPILTSTALQTPPPAAKTQKGFSPILAAMIVFFLNLLFAFAVGLALAWHRRRKAHRETPFMHEVHERLAKEGMVHPETCEPIPVGIEPEPEKHDVVEDVAASVVMESLDQAVSEADGEKPAKPPEEGVEIRTAQPDDVETKLDMSDLSF